MALDLFDQRPNKHKVERYSSYSSPTLESTDSLGLDILPRPRNFHGVIGEDGTEYDDNLREDEDDEEDDDEKAGDGGSVGVLVETCLGKIACKRLDFESFLMGLFVEV